MVEWSGEDSTSGLAAYDVQVRVDGGAWQDWRVGVTETSGVYVGILGHTYAFRSRGRDRVGTVEAWPDTPDAETKVVARVRKTYIFGGMPVAVRLHPEGGNEGVLLYLGEVDISYDVWSMGWYQRGITTDASKKPVYWNFWEGTAIVHWGRWW